MSIYRHALPQLNPKTENRLFLTDGGIETTLVFLDGFELPDFAAFVLFDDPKGRKRLAEYFDSYAAIAKSRNTGLILESATWRASPDWGQRLGYGPDRLEQANRDAIDMLAKVRREQATAATPMVISGCIGPRGDGYSPDFRMTVDQARTYHAYQAEVFADTAADYVSAITMNYVEEAIGITQAAEEAGLPAVISFTTETDGRLPTGQTLAEAIDQVDAATDNGPAYYMINCAHPTHFQDALEADAPWTRRIKGVRANASTMSHEELDNAEELDDGDPKELGEQLADLRDAHAHLNVLGGCCGTDVRHIDAIGESCHGHRHAA